MRLGGPRADEARPQPEQTPNEIVEERLLQREADKIRENINRKIEGKPPIPEAPAPARGNRLAEDGRTPDEQVMERAAKLGGMNGVVERLLTHLPEIAQEIMRNYIPGERNPESPIGKKVFDMGTGTIGAASGLGAASGTAGSLGSFGTKPTPKPGNYPIASSWTRAQRDDFVQAVHEAEPGTPAKEIIRGWRARTDGEGRPYGEAGPSDATLIKQVSEMRIRSADRANKGARAPARETMPKSVLRPDMDIQEMASPEQFARNYYAVMEPQKGRRLNMEAGRKIAERAADVLNQGQYNAFIQHLNRLKGGQ